MFPFHCFTFLYSLKLQLILQINLPEHQNIISFQNCRHAFLILYSLQLLARWAAHSRRNEHFLIFLAVHLLIPLCIRGESTTVLRCRTLSPTKNADRFILSVSLLPGKRAYDLSITNMMLCSWMLYHRGLGSQELQIAQL